MSISNKYHCHVSPISRGKGRSAVAAASYQAGAALYDERTGRLWDYSGKRGVLGSEIILPSGLSGQGTEVTRERLWNMAERAERRSDSRTAKSYEITLPDALPEEMRLALGRRLGQWVADSRQSVVDLAFHAPRPGGAGNYHVHIMATTREAGRAPDGGLCLKGKCVQELSDSKRRARGLGAGRDDIKATRLAVCDLINEALEAAGSDERVSALSYAERGINRVPTVHLGPADAARERRGERTDRGDRNREIRRRNREAEEAERELAAINAQLAALALEEKRLALLPPLDYVEAIGNIFDIRAEIPGAYDRVERQLSRHVELADPKITDALRSSHMLIISLSARQASGEEGLSEELAAAREELNEAIHLHETLEHMCNCSGLAPSNEARSRWPLLAEIKAGSQPPAPAAPEEGKAPDPAPPQPADDQDTPPPAAPPAGPGPRKRGGRMRR